MAQVKGWAWVTYKFPKSNFSYSDWCFDVYECLKSLHWRLTISLLFYGGFYFGWEHLLLSVIQPQMLVGRSKESTYLCGDVMSYIIDMRYVVALFFVLLFMYKLWLRTRLFVHGLEYPKYSHLYYSLLLIKKTHKIRILINSLNQLTK